MLTCLLREACLSSLPSLHSRMSITLIYGIVIDSESNPGASEAACKAVGDAVERARARFSAALLMSVVIRTWGVPSCFLRA